MEFRAANGRLLPGFRFHPTDEELVMYYLKRKVLGKRLEPGVIAEVDIYLFHPKDLRELACLKKDLNWYFFCPRGKKYGSGDRANRATDTGYWKATGNDRAVSYQQRTVGKIKTLVFHQGKPRKGERTDWVMHEYRLEDKNLADEGLFQDSYALCKIFKKSGWGPKNGEQYGAPFIEEEWVDNDEIPNYPQVVPVDPQNQITSAVTNSAVTNVLASFDACPTSTSEQVYSGAASVSAVDQAPPPISNDVANIASSSKGLMQSYDNVVDQVPTPILVAANWASSSEGPFSSNKDPAVQESTVMLKTADIASTSMRPVQNHDDDQMDRMLDIFSVDDLDIYGNLEDLDNRTAHGSEVTWRNFYGCGLDLTDLDGPL